MPDHAKYRAALRWAQYARRQGARFKVEEKAVEALHFSLHNAECFAIPTRLVSVRHHDDHVAALKQFDELELRVVTADDTADLIEAFNDGGPVGAIQRKHVG